MLTNEQWQECKLTWDDNIAASKFNTALRSFSYNTACALLALETNNKNYSPYSLYYTLLNVDIIQMPVSHDTAVNLKYIEENYWY